MCGIFGIVTDNEQTLGPILIEAARRLTYRGYDSVGAATISGSTIDLRKDKGRVDEVAEKYNIAEMKGQRGITQLRWATFGVPSKVNPNRIWIRMAISLERITATWSIMWSCASNSLPKA